MFGKDNKIKKMWTIIFTLLILLIPIAFMFNIIKDRKNYSAAAVNSVSSSWADVQVLKAPEMFFKQKTAKDEVILEYLTLNKYNADVKISTELRKKGIFKVPVYTADVSLQGDFMNKYGNLAGKDMELSFAVSDSRGFVTEPVLRINNGAAITAHDTSLVTRINSSAESIPFEIKYTIRGLNELYVVPDALNNTITISGNWKDPAFTGDFLPVKKEINNKEFSAQWSIPGIAASNFRKSYNEYNYNKYSGAGVSLIVPVDNYRMAERILKYAFLFLSLTFLSYFIFEIISKEDRKIHPVQYCLLGGGMLIFYMLLLSLSEFLPFLAAYLISAAMIVSLITSYTYFVITKKCGAAFSLLIAFIMIILYSFLYTLLSLQDFSLLIGSFGLFAIIAAVMYITRNVEWYNK